MKIEQFDIWLANLNPSKGSESGKARPVFIVQTNLLNDVAHPSTIICPITSNIIGEATLLRISIEADNVKLDKESAILMDQIRAIDNLRLIRKLGNLTVKQQTVIKDRLRIVLDLE
jgi:mRNA interferase MazF